MFKISSQIPILKFPPRICSRACTFLAMGGAFDSWDVLFILLSTIRDNVPDLLDVVPIYRNPHFYLINLETFPGHRCQTTLHRCQTTLHPIYPQKQEGTKKTQFTPTEDILPPNDLFCLKTSFYLIFVTFFFKIRLWHAYFIIFFTKNVSELTLFHKISPAASLVYYIKES